MIKGSFKILFKNYCVYLNYCIPDTKGQHGICTTYKDFTIDPEVSDDVFSW